MKQERFDSSSVAHCYPHIHLVGDVVEWVELPSMVGTVVRSNLTLATLLHPRETHYTVLSAAETQCASKAGKLQKTQNANYNPNLV